MEEWKLIKVNFLFKLDDENEDIGPARVWLKDEDSPGLAMSRSIGDVVANTVGVIPEPG